MKFSWLSVVAAICGISLAQSPIKLTGAIKVADPKAGSPVGPLSESVALSRTSLDGVPSPAGIANAWFGQQMIGGTKVSFTVGKSLTFEQGTPAAAQVDTLFVDLNADGKFDSNERLTLIVTPIKGRGDAPSPGETGAPVDLVFTFGGATTKAKATFFNMNPSTSLNLSFASYLEAVVKIGEEDCTVAVVDQDFDGRFGGAMDLWVLSKKGDRPATIYAMNGMSEHAFANGQSVGIKVGKDNSVEVTMAQATGPIALELDAHRTRVLHIWSSRFDKEREKFVVLQKVDTSRPVAKTPIQWNFVSFEEAIALGKQQNKAVFIDVMAFWCVWCYRMDYYTYCDQEVVDLMNSKFVPCKLIQEQAKEGEYDLLMKEKLKAKGIPAMGVFNAAGEVTHTIGGWKKPEQFLEELNKALAGKTDKGEKQGG